MTESVTTLLINQKDIEIAKLREENTRKDEIIAELQKRLLASDISKKKEPSESETVGPAHVKWSQVMSKETSVPKVFVPKTSAPKTPEKQDHGYTEGKILMDWKETTTKKGYTYWYTFIKPTVPAYTNGLNVYVSVNSHNDVVSKGTTIYFNHEEGHAKRDGTKTIKCTDNLFYTKEALSEKLKETS